MPLAHLRLLSTPGGPPVPGGIPQLSCGRRNRDPPETGDSLLFVVRLVGSSSEGLPARILPAAVASTFPLVTVALSDKRLLALTNRRALSFLTAATRNAPPAFVTAANCADPRSSQFAGRLFPLNRCCIKHELDVTKRGFDGRGTTCTCIVYRGWMTRLENDRVDFPTISRGIVRIDRNSCGSHQEQSFNGLAPTQ